MCEGVQQLQQEPAACAQGKRAEAPSHRLAGCAPKTLRRKNCPENFDWGKRTVWAVPKQPLAWKLLGLDCTVHLVVQVRHKARLEWASKKWWLRVRTNT